jgi:hypothetical protein
MLSDECCCVSGAEGGQKPTWLVEQHQRSHSFVVEQKVEEIHAAMEEVG